MIVSTFSIFQQLWRHGECPQKTMALCPFSPCNLPCLYCVFHPVFERQRLRQTGFKGVSYCFFCVLYLSETHFLLFFFLLLMKLIVQDIKARVASDCAAPKKTQEARTHQDYIHHMSSTGWLPRLLKEEA